MLKIIAVDARSRKQRIANFLLLSEDITEEEASRYIEGNKRIADRDRDTRFNEHIENMYNTHRIADIGDSARCSIS